MDRRSLFDMFLVSVVTALATSAGGYLALRQTLHARTADPALPVIAAEHDAIPPADVELLRLASHERSAADEPGLLSPEPSARHVSFESVVTGPDSAKSSSADADRADIGTDPRTDSRCATPQRSSTDADALGNVEPIMVHVRAAQEVILNNIANANTPGFKASRLNFEDLGQRKVVGPGMLDSQGRPTAVGSSLGGGVRVSARQTDHSQGTLRPTNRILDLAIQGDGFFQVNDGNRFLYTRAGSFAINGDGQMVLASADRGRPLEPQISVPIDYTEININSDGFVYVTQPGQTNLNQIGQIQLARFINPQGLQNLGENLYVNTDASGFAQISTPGQDGLGTLKQRFLEDSNVDLSAELAQLRRLQQQLDALQKFGETVSGRQ